MNCGPAPHPHLHPLPSRTVSLDPHTTAGNDHAVNVYTSPDLARWTPAGDALPVGARPTGIYFRPKVVYNAASKSYVMWINYLAPASSPLEVGPPPPTRAALHARTHPHCSVRRRFRTSAALDAPLSDF